MFQLVAPLAAAGSNLLRSAAIDFAIGKGTQLLQKLRVFGGTSASKIAQPVSSQPVNVNATQTSRTDSGGLRGLSPMYQKWLQERRYGSRLQTLGAPVTWGTVSPKDTPVVESGKGGRLVSGLKSLSLLVGTQALSVGTYLGISKLLEPAQNSGGPYPPGPTNGGGNPAYQEQTASGAGGGTFSPVGNSFEPAGTVVARDAECLRYAVGEAVKANIQSLLASGFHIEVINTDGRYSVRVS